MISKVNLLVITVICVLLFLYIADFPHLYFLNDDNVYIPASKKLNFLYGTSFRPVSDITLFFDYTLWGTHAAGYHFTNFFFHLITTVLVFLLADCLFKQYGSSTHKDYKPLAIAILFFFYPFHSEAVFWIIGRGGLLGGLFGTASLLLYVNRSKIFLGPAASIVLFLIGAFAYETIWIIPPLIVFISFLETRRLPQQRKSIVRDAFIFCSFFILYLIIRRYIIGEIGGSPYGDLAILKYDIKLWIRNYAIMSARTFLPPMQSVLLLVISYSLLLIALLFITRKLILRKKISGSMLIAGFGLGISYLPVISLGVDSHDSEAERFLYLPSVFAIILLTEILFRLYKVWFRQLTFFCLFCAELFFLSKTAKIYQTSSRVASITMEEVGQLVSSGSMYCIDLPSQYKGGLIYKNGFAEAVSWLTPHRTSRIIELSKREISQPALIYNVSHVYLKTMSVTNAAAVLQLLPRKTLDTTDVILKWTDSSLLIIQ